MGWFLLERVDLRTGDRIQRYCWQGESAEQYVELPQEAIVDLLQCFGSEGSEEPHVSAPVAQAEPELEVFTPSPSFDSEGVGEPALPSLSSLLHKQRKAARPVDEDGFEQA